MSPAYCALFRAAPAARRGAAARPRRPFSESPTKALNFYFHFAKSPRELRTFLLAVTRQPDRGINCALDNVGISTVQFIRVPASVRKYVSDGTKVNSLCFLASGDHDAD